MADLFAGDRDQVADQERLAPPVAGQPQQEHLIGDRVVALALGDEQRGSCPQDASQLPVLARAAP